MRRLIALSVFVALLGVGDYSARAFAQSKVNERAQQEAPPGSTASATVGGFPFLPRLLLSSKVSHVGVHVENVSAKVITFAAVDLDLSGVKLDRNRLLNDRKARIISIDHGTVAAVITQEALSEALRVPVTIANGQMSVTVLGKPIAVTPGVSNNGRLTLTGTGIASAFTLAIPATDYMPCISDVTVLAARIRLSCEIDEIPPALLDAAQID